MAAKKERVAEGDINVMAAVFGRSNMGQGLPSREDVERLRKPNGRGGACSLDSAVSTICGHFMESDDHYDMFVREAKSWVKNIRKDGVEEIKRVHPDIADLFWPVPISNVELIRCDSLDPKRKTTYALVSIEKGIARGSVWQKRSEHAYSNEKEGDHLVTYAFEAKVRAGRFSVKHAWAKEPMKFEAPPRSTACPYLKHFGGRNE